MAADCSFFRLSMAFTTVCVQYCLGAGRKLLIIPLVNSFHDSWAPYCSADDTLLQILPLVDSFYNGCVPYCSADGTVLLILPLVNGFPDVSRAAFFRGWQCIAHSAPCLQFSRFTFCIAQWRAEDCLFFPSFMAYTMVYTQYRSFFLSSPLSTVFTVYTLYCSVEGRGLLILPFIHGLHDGLHAVSLILPVVYDFPDLSRVLLLNPWQRIARSSTRRWVSRFAHRFAYRMVAACSFFHSSTAFITVYTQYCSAAGSRLLILPLVTGFHDSCVPYCSADGTVLLVLALANGFYGLRAVLLRGC